MSRVFRISSLSVWIMALLLVIPAWAQDAAAPTNAEEKKPQPKLEFAEPEFNFGKVQQGEKVTHVYTFKNAGDATLNITKVKTSCGCTAAILSESEIAPGKYGQIETTFNSQNFQGNIKKVIFVESNDPSQPTVQLTLQGEVEIEVVVIPPREVFLGMVEEGMEVSREITVKAGGTKPLTVSKVESNLPYISAKLLPVANGESKEFKIEVKLTPGAPVGRIEGMLKIYTDNERYKVIEERVMGVIKPKTKPAGAEPAKTEPAAPAN